jgi:hypothetical protein
MLATRVRNSWNSQVTSAERLMADLWIAARRGEWRQFVRLPSQVDRLISKMPLCRDLRWAALRRWHILPTRNSFRFCSCSCSSLHLRHSRQGSSANGGRRLEYPGRRRTKWASKQVIKQADKQNKQTSRQAGVCSVAESKSRRAALGVAAVIGDR